MTDLEEDRRAIAALMHRLREARENGETDPLGRDAEPFAAEFVAALRAFGWRPICVLPAAADWRKQPGGDTDRARQGAALARELLANRPPFVPEQGTGMATAETDHQEAGQ